MKRKKMIVITGNITNMSSFKIPSKWIYKSLKIVSWSKRDNMNEVINKIYCFIVFDKSILILNILLLIIIWSIKIMKFVITSPKIAKNTS